MVNHYSVEGPIKYLHILMSILYVLEHTDAVICTLCLILQWHESVDGDCELLKGCIEIAHICCDHDRRNRPTIQDIILMLDKLETMIKMIPLVINTEPRHDPMSSLYQVCSFK